MATIAEFSIPTDSFALAETHPEFPEVSVEADRIAAHVPDSTMPCLWAIDGDDGAFAEAMADDRTVEEITGVVEYGDEHLYQIVWSPDIDDLVTEMIDHEGVILEASGRAEEWILRLRFMSRDQFEAFRTYFADRNPSIQLERLFQAKHPRHTCGDVTPEQHESLTMTVERGYFSVPREGSIKEVADVLGVSDQAVSERIRRETENLVCDMLTVEPIQDRT